MGEHIVSVSRVMLLGGVFLIFFYVEGIRTVVKNIEANMVSDVGSGLVWHKCTPSKNIYGVVGKVSI